MAFQIRAMNLDDYDAVLALWRSSEGVGLSAADSRAGIARLLQANPGLSFVAEEDGLVVGALLGSQDSRRGYLTHLAVADGRRRKGIGRALVQACLDAMRQIGIQKCHIFVFEHNQAARAFWKQIGWVQRHELIIMSRDL